jgi:hypothetical protein
VRNNIAFFVALIAATAINLFSCGEAGFIDGRDHGEWSDGAGTSASWSPKEPTIGDLVHIEASSTTTAGLELKLPSGSNLSPIEREFLSSNVVVRWSFRVKSAGDYSFGDKKLWSVSTVAGNATELKTQDANKLWTGKAP